MNEIAKELNDKIQSKSPVFYSFLSRFGKEIYMPKGILKQGAEATAKANKFNATIGIAKEGKGPMFLPSVKKYFSDDLDPNTVFNYAPPTGVAKLREIWRDKMLADNPSIGDKSAITLPIVTSGLTHGIAIAADLFADEGDEIIIPDMLWDNYPLIYETRIGAVIKNFQSFTDDLKGFNTKGMDEAIKNSKKDKVTLLLNFPNNPAGYTPTLKEADEIVAVLKKHADAGKKILVISDDSYFGLLFDDKCLKETIFARLAGIHKNIVAIKLDGFTKEFYAWGFRVGFITFADYNKDPEAYAALEVKITGCIRSVLSNCSLPAQSIFVQALSGDAYKKEKIEKFNIMKARSEKCREVVYEKKYADCWDVYPFNSGYFMCVRLKDNVDANDFRMYVLEKHGVGTIALGKHDIRVAFSCVEENQIAEIFEILATAVREFKKK